MKNLKVLFCCLLLNLSLGMAQTSEHSLAFGFDNHPDALELLSNGNYVVVGRGVTIPGGLYGDTIFAVIFDHQGALLHKKRLLLPFAEVHDVEDLTATSDGGFVVSVSMELCDVPTDESVVQRYDSTGQLIWSQEPDGNNQLGSQLALSTDGNLITTDKYTYVTKLNINDGTILWSYPFHAPSVNFLYVRDFETIAGTDNLMAIGSPDFQYWSQGTVSGEIKYILSGSYSTPPPYITPRKIIGEASGFYYTFVDSALFRFNQFNTHEYLKKITYKFKDAIVANQNIYLLCLQDDVHRLVTTDLAGQIISDVALPVNSWLAGSLLGFHNNTFAIAGINGSGPMDGASWQEYNATNLWFRTFTDPTELPSEANNAAATGIVQSEQIAISQINLSGQATRYKIEGGGFSVQVTNHGQTLLENVDVLVGFQWNDTWICWDRPVHRRHYAGLALAPGESVWLNFGDVFANYQPVVPVELCFWTSAPNERPDGNHDDDTYCHTLLVDASEPAPSVRLHISPNPVADVLRIELSEGLPAGNWQLFNTTGQLVATALYPAGERILEVRTADFSNGLYILKVGSSIVKFVINH
ncbi:MAG TPA: T9SS type A sorting domain-containing protein [Saprospiraceae bacterium]|nr:T9SS type A sorting domain-containing protein [Saprospiraceae bacterium]